MKHIFIAQMFFISFVSVLPHARASAAGIDRHAIPDNSTLLNALDNKQAGLKDIISLHNSGKDFVACRQLIQYLKEKSTDRYYFNWRNFNRRFEDYKKKYPGQFEEHRKMAKAQMSMFSPETHWMLPSKNLKGQEVTAYELRHLARQQKSADMTLMYYYNNHDRTYLDYFVRQVADLNNAFQEGKYDDGGNAIYESYRAGKRIHNWLFNHYAYLSSADYSFENQLLLIKTFLQHGAQLQWETRNNRYGNHHTKGLVALFEIATLFPEFKVSKAWQEQAISGLAWHLTHEINEDGFQFERSVHYHMGDIENYFRVYQLASINKIELPAQFLTQFRKMFFSLVEMAQPNKRLPVLQDDTDSPYSENNDISGVMTLGTLLFRDPEFRYFAGNEIHPSVYWLLREEQLSTLDEITPEKPEIGSVALSETGYYVMRGGWNEDDLYLTITAGLSKEKPDHQHGDMLGVVAYANGTEILPNYQVRYKHEDYPFFKNSWTKNVALADSISQGRNWKPNEGGSGFGKWKFLPKPEVANWFNNEEFDYFCGSHDGFDTVGVNYYREVIFFKNDFWVIRDNFKSEQKHIYQQIWQGDFKRYEPGIFRKDTPGKSSVYLFQMGLTDYTFREYTFRDKAAVYFEKESSAENTFNTLIYPSTDRVSAEKLDSNRIQSWVRYSEVYHSPIKQNKLTIDAAYIFKNDNTMLAINTDSITIGKGGILFEEPVTVYLNINSENGFLQLLGPMRVHYQFKNNPRQVHHDLWINQKISLNYDLE